MAKIEIDLHDLQDLRRLRDSTDGTALEKAKDKADSADVTIDGVEYVSAEAFEKALSEVYGCQVLLDRLISQAENELYGSKEVSIDRA